VLVSNQGDRIGRSFAYWAIVHFGQFLEHTLWLLFSQGKSSVFKMIKRDWAKFWAIFSKKLSGHRVSNVSVTEEIPRWN
jgi:hypothetical protein